MDKNKVENTRREFPEGTLVRMIDMVDPRPIPEDMTGTVRYVDDIGNIHINWENGSTLALIPEADKFEVIRKGPPATFRLEATVKMSRPFIPDSDDYFSPGGYTIEADGRLIDFDFEDTSWGIDDKDPSIIHYMQKNPDIVAFPHLKYVSACDLEKVTSLPEFYIYTEGDGFEPVEVINVCITDMRSGKRYSIEDVNLQN